MPTCKLCLRDVPSLAKSHIIPQSFYGNTLRDPRGPARILSTAPGHRPTRSRTGVYDQTILCPECEATLSPFDDYAFRLLFKQMPSDIIDDRNEPLAAIYYTVDVEKLRTFFATLLWRMHASTKPMFKNVNLGPLAENVRLATLSKSHKIVEQVDVVLTKFDTNQNGVLGPTHWREEGVNGYRLAFAGYACLIKVDQRTFPSVFDELALSATSNQLRVLISDFKTRPERAAMRRAVLRSQNHK